MASACTDSACTLAFRSVDAFRCLRLSSHSIATLSNLQTSVQAARALRRGAAGGAKSHKGLLDRLTGFRMRTLAQLLHWGAGMAASGLLLVVLLESTRGDPRVSSFSDYVELSAAFVAAVLVLNAGAKLSISLLTDGMSCVKFAQCTCEWVVIAPCRSSVA